MNIIEELIEHRKERMKHGEIPTTIDLTEDQHRRLKEFSRTLQKPVIGPNGDLLAVDAWSYDEGRILGMDYDVAQD